MKRIFPKKSLSIKNLVYQMKNIMIAHYGSRLKFVVLYGSYARGDFRKDSDIDLLVVLDNLESEYKEIDVLTELKTDLMLENEIFISTNPTTLEKFIDSDLIFYKNVRKQGILI